MKCYLAPISAVRDQLTAPGSVADVSVYAQPAFMEFLADVTASEIQLIIAEEHGRIVGMLAIATRDQPGAGRMINSLPWYGSHGGCLVHPDHAAPDSVRRQLLCQYRQMVDNADVISATLIISHAEEAHKSIYAEELKPTVIDMRVGQITDLPPPGDDLASRLEAGFQQKTRNLVRKSLKQNLTEQVTDDPEAWDFLIETHGENILALNGKPKPRAHFDAIRKFLPPEMRRLSLAMDGDIPIAALLLLYGGRMVEYVTPAVRVEARSRQPNSFLIWHGMLDSVANGYTRWNWGGTWINQTSLHHFKAGFGALDYPYTYFINAPPAGIETLKRIRGELDALFPYFYAFPFAQLDKSRDNS